MYSILETAKLHDIDPAAYLLAAVRAADHGASAVACGRRVLPGKGDGTFAKKAVKVVLDIPFSA